MVALETLATLLNACNNEDTYDGKIDYPSLQSLFNTIIFEWNHVSDIDFSVLTDEVLIKLLTSFDDLASQLIGDDGKFRALYQALLKCSHVKSGRRKLL